MKTKAERLFTLNWHGKAVGVNDRYTGYHSKVLSPEYRNFKTSMAGEWQAQTAVRNYDKRLQLYVILFIDPARDADGLIKPIFDALELAELSGLPVQPIIKNDRQIRSYTVMAIDKESRKDPDRIRIHAYSYGYLYYNDKTDEYGVTADG